MAGHAGWLIQSTSTGGGEMSIFVFEEAEKLRIYAVRENGEPEWDVFGSAQYLVPTVPMSVGDTWPSLETEYGEQTLARAVMQETVTTAAGQFDCMRVNIERVSEPGIVIETYWFAWGVGFVRDEGYGPEGLEWRDDLTSYTILGGVGYMPAYVGNIWMLGEITVATEPASWGELKSLYR